MKSATVKTYQTRFEINGVEDAPVTVHYVAVPFHAGSTDGRYGSKLEPDEPAHIEIERVDGQNGAFELTSAQESAMEEEIDDWLMGMYDQEPPEDYVADMIPGYGDKS